MTTVQTVEPAVRKTLRLWPGVTAVVLQLLLRYVVPAIFPDALIYGVVGGVVFALLVIIWWTFFSRAAAIERWGAVLLMAASLLATSRILDKSIATGMMGMMFPMLSLPFLSVAFVAWAVLTRRLADVPRRVLMVVTILAASLGWALVRTNGITGGADSDFAWRWTKTPEERLLVAQKNEPVLAVPVAAPIKEVVTERVKPAELPVQPAAKVDGDWPGFRGPLRDGVIRSTHIETDWSKNPPLELWRRSVGPGWGSFAVAGDLLYTQEQRGDEEVVACYNSSTGKPVWAHKDVARFWESNAGAGPRGTPTLNGGRVYSFGATGILNALDASTGAVLWTRNAATDTETKTPGWGFSSSPLVLGDMVLIATSGRLAAYDAATGAARWMGAVEGSGYSSPHLMTFDGVRQVVLMTSHGASSVSPGDGKLLWKHSWPPSSRIVQPAITEDGDLLMEGGEGTAMRRIAVVHGPDGEWTTSEKWTSNGLKPYFSDFVVHNGFVFGLDGSILACIDATDGKRKWKGGRYGPGQVLLLRDQGVLLLLSEQGELALVKAEPSGYTELGRVPALEGKTWNHPVLTGDRLLVRNGTEMAAFKLALAH